MAAKIKKGDRVVVLTGRDKGRSERPFFGQAQRGARDRARGQHRETSPEANRQGQEAGIITKEAPIHLSNLAIADPKNGKPTRVGFKILG